HPAVDPGGDRVDLLLAQAGVVRVITESRIRRPRRHLALRDARLDRAGPRAHFFETGQRHRTARTRWMAGRALLEEDWRNIAVERRGGHSVRRQPHGPPGGGNSGQGNSAPKQQECFHPPTHAWLDHLRLLHEHSFSVRNTPWQLTPLPECAEIIIVSDVPRS